MDLMDQKIKHEELWGAEPNATEDELSDIIGSLSRLFSSTYYVNLEQDTYRAVIQLRRVGDVLGNEVNYTSAIRIYAQYFVHPEDQAEYLQAMDVENLRRELRWWQPCVAVEYRRPAEEPAFAMPSVPPFMFRTTALERLTLANRVAAFTFMPEEPLTARALL